ncbi:MAG: inorganic phosphate transporter [Bacteroidota bacterium]
METLYLILVILLLGLAIFDLIVGVSNDAVNFLTSAIGSKAGSFKKIMIIASLGIFIGAVSSGGMMEIAKSGVFSPNMFSFKDIIFIYVAVMLSDILLLDLFNSLKLPTSTTISIVFELLGASFAVSMLKIYQSNSALSDITSYLNSSKAIQMITAIFVSVAVAFVIGWVVQFAVRALVTFDYLKFKKVSGSIIGALSVSIVFNFIFNVALKNSPIKDTTIVSGILDHLLIFALMIFLITFVLFYLLSRKPSFDPFKVITLIGTFALAMAFASNDLVNFIGVPIASYEAYHLWKESGLEPEAYNMQAFLDKGNATNPLFMLAAGIIMAATLWISKKARNVIQTSVNLSSQKDSVERFAGNDLVRTVVRFFTASGKFVNDLLPENFIQAVERRYSVKTQKNIYDRDIAFDFVRASTNLIVAAFLISMGTTLKLPLSTTYVSFMVLMGTSLADKAWNKDSAVYRVSGVFAVVSGWFLTAISALVISSFFAVLLFKLQFIGILIGISIVGLVLYLIHKSTDSSLQQSIQLEMPDEWFTYNPEKIKKHLEPKVDEIITKYQDFLKNIIDAIISEDNDEIIRIDKQLKLLNEVNYQYGSTLNEQLKTVKLKDIETGKLLLHFYTLEEKLLENLEKVAKTSKLHILNMHSSLTDHQIEKIKQFQVTVNQYLDKLLSDFDNIKRVRYLQDRELLKINEEYISYQVKELTTSDNKYNYKNSFLYFQFFYQNMDSILILKKMALLVKG